MKISKLVSPSFETSKQRATSVTHRQLLFYKLQIDWKLRYDCNSSREMIRWIIVLKTFWRIKGYESVYMNVVPLKFVWLRQHDSKAVRARSVSCDNRFETKLTVTLNIELHTRILKCFSTLLVHVVWTWNK